MENEKTERLKLFKDLLFYCVISKRDGSVFATTNSELHKIAEELITRGWLIESTAKYMPPGSKDRCFELTSLGVQETNFITIVSSEIVEAL
jgi:hypothetical protein